MTTKLPSIPPSREKNLTVEKLKELAEIWKGERGDKLDQVVTRRDLIGLDLAKISRAGILQGIPAGQEPQPDIIPTALTNLTANGGFGFIFLDWDGAEQLGYSYTEIWRSSDDNLANAVLSATSIASLYVDDNVSSGQGFYYWVRAISETGDPGPFNATAGTYGEAVIEPDYIIGILEGRISESELAAELLTPIQSIPSIQTTLDTHSLQIPDLDSRLLDAEGDIAAQSGTLASVQSQINDLTIAPFDANTNYAVNDLFRYNDVIYQVIATQTPPNVTPPNATYYDPKPDYESLSDIVSANAAAVESLDTRVTTAEGTLTSQASSITTLSSDMTTAQSDITGNTDAITLLDARVVATENDITSNSASITALESQVNDLTVSEFDANTSYAINDIFRYNDDYYKVIATQTPPNATPPNGTYYEFLPDYQGLSGEVAANASAIESLETRVTSTETTITAQSSSISSLQSELDAAESDISANAGALAALDTRVTDAEGDISSQSTAVTQLENTVNHPSTGVTANAGAIGTLTSRLDTTDANVTAISSDVTTLRSDVDDNYAAVQTKAEASVVTDLQGRVTSVESKWVLQLDVNGRVVGIALANDGDESSMVVASDALYFIDPGISPTPFNPNTDYPSLDALRNTQFIFGYARVEGHQRFVINIPAYIPDASITTAQISNATINQAQIDDLNVNTAEIADGAITTAKIGLAQITRALIGDAAIGTAQIELASIDTARIAGNAITMRLLAETNFDININQVVNSALPPVYTVLSIPIPASVSALNEEYDIFLEMNGQYYVNSTFNRKIQFEVVYLNQILWRSPVCKPQSQTGGIYYQMLYDFPDEYDAEDWIGTFDYPDESWYRTSIDASPYTYTAQPSSAGPTFNARDISPAIIRIPAGATALTIRVRVGGRTATSGAGPYTWDAEATIHKGFKAWIIGTIR